MSLQKKLQKAEQEGYIKGAKATWDLMEQMFTEIDGIGPKTKEKILKSVKEYATIQKSKLNNMQK